jgi:hypothetical protein
MLIYIEHPERPFKLHVFIGIEPTEISKRFNKYKKKKFYFPKGYFVPEHGEDEACLDISASSSWKFPRWEHWRMRCSMWWPCI